MHVQAEEENKTHNCFRRQYPRTSSLCMGVGADCMCVLWYGASARGGILEIKGEMGGDRNQRGIEFEKIWERVG